MANKRVLLLRGATAGIGLRPAHADQMSLWRGLPTLSERADGRVQPCRPMCGRNAALQGARIPCPWTLVGVEQRLLEIGVRKGISGGLSTTGIQIFQILGIANSNAASAPQAETSVTQTKT